MLARGLQQHVRAQRVGAHERVRFGDRAIDVRLGGEVDDRRGRARVGSVRRPVERERDRRGVLDRAVDEAEARIVGEVVEVLLAPGVGELVEHGHLVAVLPQALAHERRADEAGSAADEQFHARIIPSLAATRLRRANDGG